MDDLDEIIRLMERVNIVSYDLDYQKNLQFAFDIGLSGKRAQEFAKGATEEQRQIDYELQKKLQRDKKRERIFQWLARKRVLSETQQDAELDRLLNSFQRLVFNE